MLSIVFTLTIFKQNSFLFDVEGRVLYNAKQNINLIIVIEILICFQLMIGNIIFYSERGLALIFSSFFRRIN